MKQLTWSFLLLIGSTVTWAQAPNDPTRPPASWLKNEGPAERDKTFDVAWPQINAVIHKQGQFKALIGNELFVEGQQWQGMTIIRIRPSEVVFDGPDGPVTRQVSPQNIKKEVAQNEV